MRLISLCAIVFLFKVCYGQIEKEVIKEPFESLCRLNNNIFYEVNNKKKKLYLNGRAIDSTGLDLRGKVLSQNSLIGYSFNDKTGYIFYSVLLDGEIKKLNRITNHEIYTTRRNFFNAKIWEFEQEGTLYTYSKRNFFRLDLQSGVSSDFIDIDKASGLDSLDARELCDVYELDDGRLVATICDCYGECVYYQYYLVDIATGNVTKIELNAKEPFNDESYSVKIIENDAQYIQVAIFGAERNENNGVFIYDLNFKEISRSLERKTSTIGTNYKGSEYVSDNVKTFLDDGRAVIIIYKFSMPLERSFYQIYNNLPLFPEDIKMCSAHELDLLKNMVFARHNYKFQSEFYQAYFNLYSFYSSEDRRKTRLKEITRLLTAEDKSNLSLITKSSKK